MSSMKLQSHISSSKHISRDRSEEKENFKESSEENSMMNSHDSQTYKEVSIN